MCGCLEKPVEVAGPRFELWAKKTKYFKFFSNNSPQLYRETRSRMHSKSPHKIYKATSSQNNWDIGIKVENSAQVRPIHSPRRYYIFRGGRPQWLVRPYVIATQSSESVQLQAPKRWRSGWHSDRMERVEPRRCHGAQWASTCQPRR
jgi:hypothetical protein